MSKRDYYVVLGVERNASQEQIKKAYRQLALKYHPDRNPGNKESEEAFKEATEAYQILFDPENRAKYDRFGHAAFAQGGGFEGFGDFGSFAEEIFGDLFGAFFGTTGSKNSKRVRTGRDLRYKLVVTLEESASGIEKNIKIKKPVPCEPCQGKGGREGKAPEKCKQCGGLGQVRMQQGFFAISRPCPVCRGQGSIVTDPCPSCGGTGSGSKEKELAVQVPAGIDSGQQLKLRGEGEELGGDGISGDLYVEIEIEPHKIFSRQETEILCEIPITYSQAVLGAELDVPTLTGATKLKIPSGTESGRIFKINGKGIVDLRSGRPGDQHVRVHIDVPQSISPRERELLEELGEIQVERLDTEKMSTEKISPNSLNGDSKSFLDKVKEFFD